MRINTNEEKSFVYIEFEGIGSAEITNYNLQNVSPLQLLAMASYMEFEGKAALSVANLERQQLQRIAVPKSTIELGKK
jgi:hypothetical protein